VSWYEIILLSFGLGVDAFSVAIVVGSTIFGPRQIFRLSFHFGLFQFMMPLIGWQLGEAASTIIGNHHRWVAFIILIVIGGKMLKDAFSAQDDGLQTIDRTRKWSLVFLSIATSIDALGAGFGLGPIARNFLAISAIIGITALIMTTIGMVLGNFLKRYVGKRMEAVGGAVLIFLGFRILMS